MGRPSKYTEAMADDICARIACGESMRAISFDPVMPAMSTLFKWLREHQEFSEQYARAKEESGDVDAERIEDVAKDVLDGKVDPASGRVAIDAFKWTASKKRPKKYGDKVQQELTGRDGAPIEVDNHHTIEFVDASGNNLINEAESK